MAQLRVENGGCDGSSVAGELEHAQLWPRVWLCAGRASDAASPGRYFTFELGHDVVLVVNDAGTLRAFHNVCQHRGHPLRPCGHGTATDFRCPYHGWTYSLGGRLEHVPDRHTFPGHAPSDEFSLKPLGCEERGGFVWVHLGEARESLTEHLGELDPKLHAWGIGGWAVGEHVTAEVAANWKTALEDVEGVGYRVFPNLTLTVGVDHAVVHRARPHPRDPERSFLDVWRLRAP